MKRSSLQPGVDVPWVTSWTEESVIGVRACPTVEGRPALAQIERPGFGRPQYSQNHLVRQRVSVRRMLCPMCGRPTVPGDRWTQVARLTSAGTLRRAGKTPTLSREIEDGRVVLDAGSIAPLHKTCVDFSLTQCPHLKDDPTVDVMRFPSRWMCLPLMIEATPAVEPSGFAGYTVMVVTFLQLCGITDRVDRDWRFRRPRLHGTSA